MPAQAIPRPLSIRQLAFVREYLVCGVAKDAYVKAGYKATGKAAEAGAVRLLRQPEIQAAIAARQEKLERKGDVSLEELLEEHRAIAFGCIDQVLDFENDTLRFKPAHTIPASARRMIASIKVKRFTEGKGDAAREVEVIEFKLHNKLESLAEIARLLGLYKPTKIAPTSPDGSRPYQPLTLEQVLERMAQMAMPARDAGAEGGQGEEEGES